MQTFRFQRKHFEFLPPAQRGDLERTICAGRLRRGEVNKQAEVSAATWWKQHRAIILLWCLRTSRTFSSIFYTTTGFEEEKVKAAPESTVQVVSFIPGNLWLVVVIHVRGYYEHSASAWSVSSLEILTCLTSSEWTMPWHLNEYKNTMSIVLAYIVLLYEVTILATDAWECIMAKG